jgi:hypothetical protein
MQQQQRRQQQVLLHAAAADAAVSVDQTLNPLVASLSVSKTMALTDLARSMKESGIDVSRSWHDERWQARASVPAVGRTHMLQSCDSKSHAWEQQQRIHRKAIMQRSPGVTGRAGCRALQARLCVAVPCESATCQAYLCNMLISDQKSIWSMQSPASA